MNKKVTIKELKNHIIKYNKAYNGTYVNFLELLLNRKISKNVASYFQFKQGNYIGFNWYGNYKMEKLIQDLLNNK